MTNKDQEFLRALLKAFEVFDGDAEALDRSARDKLVKKISDYVDMDLVNALNQWLLSQRDAEKPFSNGQLSASIAYTLALIITSGALDQSQTEDNVCLLSQVYGDYLHRVSHSIYRGEKAEREKSKKSS